MLKCGLAINETGITKTTAKLLRKKQLNPNMGDLELPSIKAIEQRLAHRHADVDRVSLKGLIAALDEYEAINRRQNG